MKAYIHITSILIITLLSYNSFSQRFSYVDTEYILSKMPEYRSAQKQLDNFAQEWKKELDAKRKEIESLWKEYQAEKVISPKEINKQKEDKILKKEDELNKFKQEKFGKNGELFKKRKELIKPIQDKVFDGIQKLAKEEDQDFIFDKSASMTMLFTNAKYDRSDEVLEILGIEISDNKDSEEEGIESESDDER